MSRAVSLMDLAGEIARKHERAATGRITVIPVLVDDLQSTLPVLAALCAVTEGRFLNTLEEELQTPVLGTKDPIRRAAISESMTGQPTTPRHVKLVDRDAGLVDAVFANPSSVSPSLVLQPHMLW